MGDQQDVIQEPTLQEPQVKTFSEEEVLRRIEEARKQEKDKLYGKVNTLTENTESMKAELEALRKEREDREAKEAAARKKVEDETKRLAEEKLSAQELVEARAREFEDKLNQERTSWEQKFTQLEQQREQERLISQKEREFAELTNYIRDCARNAETDASIHSSLLSQINGNTKEEVDQSIDQLKKITDAIVADFQQVAQQQRAAMPGVSTAGYTNIGPESTLGTDRITIEDLKNMPMSKYAEFRQKNGIGQSGQGKGLF